MSADLAKVLSSELKAANTNLEKWESKLLEGSGDKEDKEYFRDRVAYWSSVATQVREALCKVKEPA